MSNIEEIITDEKQTEEFITKFKRFATQVGEFLIEPLDKEHILTIFNQQGYWAGVANRIHYDAIQGFVAQPRLFGV